MHKHLVAFAFLLLCPTVTIVSTAQEEAGEWQLYIGTYTHGDSAGIYQLTMNRESGLLAEPSLAVETENPSFLAMHPVLPVIYSVGNGTDDDGQRKGFINAFSIDEGKKGLRFINRQPVKGVEPCHLTLSRKGDYTVVANYGNGTVSLFPVNERGETAPLSGYWQHSGSSINPTRQEGPHAHSTTFNEDSTHLYVADLGIDQILLYHFDADSGTLTLDADNSLTVAPGSGPRHVAFHPHKPFTYIVNELANTVTVCRYHEGSGKLEYLQTVATLPEDFEENSTTAEIRVHPSGNFVYASNRGHDSIAVFAVDSANGLLTSSGQVQTGGKSPRHFSLSPDGAFCVVGNELTSTLRSFRIAPDTGLLEDLQSEVTIANAVCVLFYSQKTSLSAFP